MYGRAPVRCPPTTGGGVPLSGAGPHFTSAHADPRRFIDGEALIRRVASDVGISGAHQFVSGSISVVVTDAATGNRRRSPEPKPE